jgi:hypothetical protein
MDEKRKLERDQYGLWEFGRLGGIFKSVFLRKQLEIAVFLVLKWCISRVLTSGALVA